MGNTNTDGQNSDVEKVAPGTTEELPSAKAESEKNEPFEAPFKGFSSDGNYFLVKIDIRYGYLSILGWLQEAADFLKFHVARQREEQLKKTIIKPSSKGIGGRFNLFKGK